MFQWLNSSKKMHHQHNQTLVTRSKCLSAILFALGIVTVLILTGPIAHADTNIVWSDEFNGTSIDTTKWTFETGTGCPNCGWGNSELEYYTARTNNAFIDGNGLLHIVARQESYGGQSFTSARMKTQGLYNTPVFGLFEWRAKLPSGTGMWPALWLLGSNIVSVGWPTCGEIDVVENNGATPTWVQGSLHWANNNGRSSTTS